MRVCARAHAPQHGVGGLWAVCIVKRNAKAWRPSCCTKAAATAAGHCAVASAAAAAPHAKPSEGGPAHSSRPVRASTAAIRVLLGHAKRRLASHSKALGAPCPCPCSCS